MRSRQPTKLLTRLIVLLTLSLIAVYFRQHQPAIGTHNPDQTEVGGLTDPAIIRNAYEQQKSNFQVKQAGRIIKILKEDNYGPRHQRFLVQINDGRKLLIAHNIDLAPKVETLKVDEQISFYGEYEWNNKGGVIHWTHHDPKKRHPDGWLMYGNKKYQ